MAKKSEAKSVKEDAIVSVKEETIISGEDEARFNYVDLFNAAGILIAIILSFLSFFVTSCMWYNPANRTFFSYAKTVRDRKKF